MATVVFADLPTLRAALESGLVPAAVQASPTSFAYTDDARLAFEPSADLDRSERRRLREAGVEVLRRKLRDGQPLSCWAEAMHSEASAEPTPPLGEVLFLSEGDEAYLGVSGELLRLGASDQRLAFFCDSEERRWNLCRVADPPYYAVLRALERDTPLRAFALARPGGRVWVELGYRHPQGERLECAPGQLLLIPGRPEPNGDRAQTPRWLRPPDGPWTELDALTDVTLPATSTWTPRLPERRLQVTPRLVRAPQGRAPDLWVVSERALEQVERLVTTVPDDVIARLRVCTAEGPEGTVVVLRARRSAEGPPALDLDAQAYVPAAQIPELYLPLGTTIDPPLRPSRLRELLVGDDRRAQKLVWLTPDSPSPDSPGPALSFTPGPALSFTRASLDEAAFAPLAEWVDYIVSAGMGTLEPWVLGATFDLDDFVSVGVEWSDGQVPKQSRSKVDGRRRQRGSSTATREAPEAEVPEPESDSPDPDPPTASVDPSPVEVPRSEAEERLRRLETNFCALELPLGDPARAPLWAELGSLQAGLQRSREAGLCWSRALWTAGPHSGPTTPALARRWAQSEADLLGCPDHTTMLGMVDVVEDDLDEDMVRAAAAAVIVRTCEGAETPPLQGEQLVVLQRFFATHGPLLDLRTLWLVRAALADAAGDDRLALFQTRDAILGALRDGVGLARNIPAFVRGYGSSDQADDLGRLAQELEQILGTYRSTSRLRSTIESTHPELLTHAYVHLIFAWGMARLGRPRDATELLQTAHTLLGARLDPPPATTGDPVHLAAFLAYRARIEQALEGLPPGAPFSADPDGPITARERLGNMERFKYDRLVELSRILDPRHDVDAFERWGQKDDEPFEGLALLTKPKRLAALFDRILAAQAGLGPERRAKDLGMVLEYLEALPEALALPRLELALAGVGELELPDQPRLLRNALLLAGYYDRSELVATVMTIVERHGDALATELPAEYANFLAQAAPTLRRAGFELRLGVLLTQLHARVGNDRELTSVIAQLHLAAARASLGSPESVQTAVDSALSLLPELSVPSDRQLMVREIAVALGRSTPGQAIAGARTLMGRLAETSDSMSTNSHYCLAVVQLMEAVVRSLASEDLTLSDWARRWVEEDEHLLHRRIHRDLARSAGG